MAVAKIEEYPVTGVAKVILKPTRVFPQGWFYTDIEHLDIVNSYTWYFSKPDFNRLYIRASIGSQQNILFQQALAEKILGYKPRCIDHINLLELDNTDRNMNIVTAQQNRRNTPCRGYTSDKWGFTPYIAFDCKAIYKDICHFESDVALTVYLLRKQYYSDYDYDFLKDRRNDLDIVDLQYTGQISEEEATFRHVMRYAKDNAWYVYRYNLFDYFKQYHVPIPEFRLDERGFMVHQITGQRLCPFQKGV